MDELHSDDPRRIGPYWLEKRLGAGGMGCVYLGRSTGGHHVAIKAIREELADDPNFRTRFAREVAAARKVNGIFTAPVVDADMDGPVPWLATTYIPGPSLADAVARGGPLPATSVLTLAAGLAEGLQAIHSAGIVHRDLKPSNVILADDGPRLIDFGISQSAGMSSLTCTGMVLGSPGFMSPEQAAGHEVGPPSDIFSLGAVLAFAATGHGPFGEGTTVELLFRVVNKDPDTHDVPAEIRHLVERCLAKNPLSRPTASRLLAELGTPLPTATQPAKLTVPLPRAPVPAPARTAPAAATRRDAVPGQRRDGNQTWEPTATVTPWRPAYPGPGGPTTAPRRQPARWAWLAGFATVLVVAAVAVLLAWRAGYLGGSPAASRSSPPASASSQPTSASSQPTGPTATARPPGAVTMTALASYLAQSAAVRPTVQPAIDRVRSCAVSPSTGQAAMQQAVNARQRIVFELQGLSPADLPSGAQMISTLTSAMRESVNADRHYQDWMADFAVAGSPCGSDPSQDPNFAAGQEASARATAAKKAFVLIWNPLAPRYGQRTYSATEF
ncbi:MAG TPA: serine/threonine-protein kinase [Trebonia sp.]